MQGDRIARTYSLNRIVVVPYRVMFGSKDVNQGDDARAGYRLYHRVDPASRRCCRCAGPNRVQVVTGFIARAFLAAREDRRARCMLKLAHHGTVQRGRPPHQDATRMITM